MSATSYSATISVDQPADVVLGSVLDVRGWWSPNITGAAAKVGDVFHFSDQGITSSTFRLVEIVPDARVVWHIDDAYLSFVDDNDEWTGTRVIFDITPGDDGSASTVHFTHDGLLQTVECFTACSSGWDMCMTSLKQLIEAGSAPKN